jgi:hypothetical protein
MAVISIANLLSACDKIGDAWYLQRQFLGQSASSPIAYTPNNALNNLQTLYLGLNDPVQEQMLLTPYLTSAILNICADKTAPNQLNQLIQTLISYCNRQGNLVSSTIRDLNTFLSYYNGGLGATKFSNPATYEFGQLYQLLTSGYLSYPNAVSESINSLWNSTLYPHGLGSVTYAGTFTSGVTVNSNYAEPRPVAMITTTFVGGSGNLVVTPTGTSDLGTTGLTWSVTFGSNNPTATFSTQTVSSGAVSAQTRNVLTVSSTAGFCVGAVVVLDKGKPNQEYTVVEAASFTGTTFTCTCQQAHAASFTVDGNTQATLAVGTAPSGARIRSVQSVALTGSTWSAGVVQICGGADRLGV